MHREVPLEIWFRIFTLACISDTNTTALSLCLVSKFFYDACKTLRFRNLTLTRTREVLKLNAAILARPPRERVVRNLVVGLPSLWELTSDEENQSDYIPSDDEDDSSGSSVREEDDSEGSTNGREKGGAEGESVGNHQALLARQDVEEDVAFISTSERYPTSIEASHFPPFDSLDFTGELTRIEDAVFDELGKALKIVSSTLRYFTLLVGYSRRRTLPFAFSFSALTHLILSGSINGLPVPDMLEGNSTILFPVLLAFCIEREWNRSMDLTQFYHGISKAAPRLEYLHIPHDEDLLYATSERPPLLGRLSSTCKVVMDLTEYDYDQWKILCSVQEVEVEIDSRIEFRFVEDIYYKDEPPDAPTVSSQHMECAR